ncbi:hypothetical protein BC833DRAFT_606584 [Globomyces pollinis-pini]|nr:hypothetical protein BC833DRAFT_606584 [Globomyces pollinis-pini]
MRGSANSTLSIDDCCLPEAGLYCRNSRLTQIRFSTNSLFGVIPNNIVGLDALEVIVIQNNRVSGIIPPQIGSLSLLTILDLKNNSLTGPIPSEIGNLKSLTQLFLSNNSFAGVVPKEVLALPKYVSDPNSRFFQ